MKQNNVKIKPVILPPNMDVCSHMLSYIHECMQNDDDVTNICIQKDTLEHDDLTKLYFENVCFENCTFLETSFERSSFKNVRFNSCAFPGCDFSSGWFSQCAFENSQFKSSNFRDCRLNDIVINDCNMQYANFTSSRFNRIQIVQSDMSNAFFAECIFKLVTVDRSQFVHTEFFHTPLKDMDFTTCTIAGICVSEQCKELSGIIVNLYQAAQLSTMLGIVIKD